MTKSTTNDASSYKGQRTPSSHLERVLREGHFAVTAELSSPDSADPERVFKLADELRGNVDAINATDASSANVHISSLAVCALVKQLGLEGVLQVSCRDRNRIAFQGNALGASALGIHNILCLTGDGVQAGDQPETKPVFDLDGLQLLNTLRVNRDHGIFLSGRKITPPPNYFLGAAANPFAPPFEWRPARLAKKIQAGAQFIQTQYVFDLSIFRDYMKRVVDMGLHEQAYILAGVGPIRSDRVARYMADNVPGVIIPEEIIRRLAGKEGKDAKAQEGVEIAVEIVDAVREIQGVSGIHLMAYPWESAVGEIVHRTNLYPRPLVKQLDDGGEVTGDRS